MGLSFTKKPVVGVSITPDIGIEVIQIDFDNKCVLNYASRAFEFDSKNLASIDRDVFKETLYDLLVEIGAPVGSEVVLNIPTNIFKVQDMPASIDSIQLIANIEDEIAETPAFQNNPQIPSYSYCILPNSTIQFNKIVYTATYNDLIMELALRIKELKYKLIAIDTAVNSSLNALMYCNRVEVNNGDNWVMLIIDNNYCRILPMQGKNYVDSYEERIAIGRVLGDAENYDIVVKAISPILKNLPSSLLYVVSKTDLISAKILADNLSYNAPIVHQEANSYNNEPLIDVSIDISQDLAKNISLDVIGAAIKRDFGSLSAAPINLFNEQLGDLYLSQIPPKIKGYELSVENMLKIAIPVALTLLVLTFIGKHFIDQNRAGIETQLQSLNIEAARIQKFLNENSDISTNKFNETDEIRIGLTNNKNIYKYYSVVGQNIPRKLWLTYLNLGAETTIEGQADNLESVYSFFRSIKEQNITQDLKLQKLGLSGKSKLVDLPDNEGFDTESVLTSMNADFYEFKISNVTEPAKNKEKANKENNLKGLPDLEPIE